MLGLTLIPLSSRLAVGTTIFALRVSACGQVSRDQLDTQKTGRELTSSLLLARLTSSRVADQSRKCPLCSHPIGAYLLHNLWTPPPFLKVGLSASGPGPAQFFLPPLVSKPSSAHPQNPRLPPPTTHRAHATRRRGGEALDSTVEETEDAFERTVERRRELYRWGLFAKVSRGSTKQCLLPLRSSN
jgi:hypothetical protein